MNFLFAHHDLGLSEYLVLGAIFAAGFWLGWDVIAKLTAARQTAASGDDVQQGN